MSSYLLAQLFNCTVLVFAGVLFVRRYTVRTRRLVVAAIGNRTLPGSVPGSSAVEERLLPVAPPWTRGPTPGRDDSSAALVLPRFQVEGPAAWRAADFVLALALEFLTAPFVLLAAILVKLTSRGPIFYSQVRVGQGGRTFRIYKLRTMFHNCEALSGARWSTPGDPRITMVGRWLRRSHLDELPALWNVIRGDLSLIGPASERPEFVCRLEQAIPLYRTRLLVRPGMTGLAQLLLPPATDVASVGRIVAYDLYYVHKKSLLLDLRILFGTFLRLLGFSPESVRQAAGLPDSSTIELFYEELKARLSEPQAPRQREEAEREIRKWAEPFDRSAARACS